MNTAVARKTRERRQGATDALHKINGDLSAYARQFSTLTRQPEFQQALSRRAGRALLKNLTRLRDAVAHAVVPAADTPANHAMDDLIASSQVLTPAVFADRMGWSRQALSKALAAHRVFFLESEGRRYFPAFFADARYERRHLEAVARLLGELPGGAKWLFFTTPKGSLSRLTPLQALERGKVTQVKTAAQGFAER